MFTNPEFLNDLSYKKIDRVMEVINGQSVVAEPLSNMPGDAELRRDNL